MERFGKVRTEAEDETSARRYREDPADTHEPLPNSLHKTQFLDVHRFLVPVISLERGADHHNLTSHTRY